MLATFQFLHFQAYKCSWSKLISWFLLNPILLLLVPIGRYLLSVPNFRLGWASWSCSHKIKRMNGYDFGLSTLTANKKNINVRTAHKARWCVCHKDTLREADTIWPTCIRYYSPFPDFNASGKPSFGWWKNRWKSNRLHLSLKGLELSMCLPVFNLRGTTEILSALVFRMVPYW